MATSTWKPSVSTASAPYWSSSHLRTASAYQAPGGSASGGEGAPALLVGLRGRDEPLLGHAPEHVLLSTLRPRGVAYRRPARGRLDHPGEHRGLAQGHLADGLAEQEAARLLHAVPAVPEVDLVQVQVEDLVLGQVLLEAWREDQLLHLPLG